MNRLIFASISQDKEYAQGNYGRHDKYQDTDGWGGTDMTFAAGKLQIHKHVVSQDGTTGWATTIC